MRIFLRCSSFRADPLTEQPPLFLPAAASPSPLNPKIVTLSPPVIPSFLIPPSPVVRPPLARLIPSKSTYLHPPPIHQRQPVNLGFTIPSPIAFLVLKTHRTHHIAPLGNTVVLRESLGGLNPPSRPTTALVPTDIVHLYSTSRVCCCGRPTEPSPFAAPGSKCASPPSNQRSQASSTFVARISQRSN